MKKSSLKELRKPKYFFFETKEKHSNWLDNLLKIQLMSSKVLEFIEFLGINVSCIRSQRPYHKVLRKKDVVFYFINLLRQSFEKNLLNTAEIIPKSC